MIISTRVKRNLVGITAGIVLAGGLGLVGTNETANAKTIPVSKVAKAKKLKTKFRMNKPAKKTGITSFDMKITNSSKYGTRFYFTQLVSALGEYAGKTGAGGMEPTKVLKPHKSVYIKPHKTVTVRKAYSLKKQGYSKYFSNRYSNAGIFYGKKYGTYLLQVTANPNNYLTRKQINSTKKHFYQHKKFYSYVLNTGE